MKSAPLGTLATFEMLSKNAFLTWLVKSGPSMTICLRKPLQSLMTTSAFFFKNARPIPPPGRRKRKCFVGFTIYERWWRRPINLIARARQTVCGAVARIAEKTGMRDFHAKRIGLKNGVYKFL